jgi:hypothetical protein
MGGGQKIILGGHLPSLAPPGAATEHKIIVKNCQLKYIINDALKLTPCLQPYKQNLLNSRRHFLLGVPSKIFSF